MTRGDIIGLISSYVYAFALLYAVEAIGKAAKWSQGFTRKLIHIGAGMWVWALIALFDHWYFGIIPFATFIVLNYIFYRQQTFEQMDDEASTPGTVYFAISITVLFVLLWRTEGQPDHLAIAVAAVMAMTLGDAFAYLIGKPFGRRFYEFFGHQRTWAGSLAMLLVSFAAILVTLLIVPGSALSPNGVIFSIGSALILAAVGAIVATAAEAISPAGTDNLTVPLITGAVLYVLSLIV